MTAFEETKIYVLSIECGIQEQWLKLYIKCVMVGGNWKIIVVAQSAPWNPQTSQAIAKTLGFSPQTDSKAPSLNTSRYDSLNLEMPSRCLQRGFIPLFQCLCYREVLCMLSKEKHTHQPSHKPSVYNSVLPAVYDRTMVAQSLWQ